MAQKFYPEDYDAILALRLVKLRQLKGLSARELSLQLGMSPGYINAVENHKSLPSMQVFFYICFALDVSPAEFFDLSNSSPTHINKISSSLKKLPPECLKHLEGFFAGLPLKQTASYCK